MLHLTLFSIPIDSCVYLLHLCIEVLPMNLCHVTDNNINKLTSSAVL